MPNNRIKKIVTIGGGTGSFTLLSGLKKYPFQISAIVTMADDGGSTGVLRDELGVLPPGDIRQCLVALSDSPLILRQLINYRFERGSLRGHSFGNLLLSALEKINGSFGRGVEIAGKILDVRGEVIPVTENNMRLFIQLKNGKIIKGEKELHDNAEINDIGIAKVFARDNVHANKRALKKIQEADIIIIGPGDLYSSILPNLIVKGIRQAINNSKAKVIFNCNLTNKRGLTEGMGVCDYVDIVNAYLKKTRINYVTCNVKQPPEKLVKKYEKQEGKDMLVRLENKLDRNYKIVKADLLYEGMVESNKHDVIKRAFIRHDPDKLAKVINLIMEMGDRKLVREVI